MRPQNYRISNLVFATLHVSDRADPDRFVVWLKNSPMHCLVVLCQPPMSAAAERLMQSSRGSSASNHGLNETKEVISVTSSAAVFIVLNRSFVTFGDVKKHVVCGDAFFIVFEFNIQERSTAVAEGHSTAVAVGVVIVRPCLSNLPRWLMDVMSESVRTHRVRCFTGIFGVNAEQMTRWASEFPMATDEPVHTPWLSSGSAVAVFPSYTLLLGMSSATRTIKLSEMETSAVAVQRRWASSICASESVLPTWYKWPHYHVKNNLGGDLDWGHVKMKKVDPKHWLPYVHQVVFWCGTAQTGKAAAERHDRRWNQGQAASSWNR